MLIQTMAYAIKAETHTTKKGINTRCYNIIITLGKNAQT